MQHLSTENKAGLYITVIFHLAVIIVLLLVQIGSELKKDNSFLMDFSHQEKEEQELKEEVFKESISRRIDDMIADMGVRSSSDPVRNVTVDRSAPLRDDRNTDAEELYRENERLQRDLKGLDSREEDARSETVDISRTDSRKSEPAAQKKAYSGASVLSWTLDGRKASSLKVPAYQCYGGGDVTVIIKVNNSGVVMSAKIVEVVSSTDDCLRRNAVRAARTSRFSASTTAPANQVGEITYRFVAQ